jgi:peptide/nickel transport system ATP-binding protein/oligopeptide transport system ATP-binding protein
MPPLLQISNLSVHFPVKSGFLQRQTGVVKALDDVSLSIEKGCTLGLVGESGSGKTTLGRAIVRLVDPTAGSVSYQGHVISTLRGSDLRPYRKKIQMVFQDPYNSLNPRLRIGTILAEPLEIHFPKMSPSDRATRVAELLELVGLDPAHARRFPHEFSGGQRQRIGIARALAVEPEFIICDEPANGLDPAGISWLREMFRYLAGEGRTVFVSSHQLAEMAQTADELVVIRKGGILVTQCSLDDFIATGTRETVKVRSPQAAQLAPELTREGAIVGDVGGDSFTATGNYKDYVTLEQQYSGRPDSEQILANIRKRAAA